MSYTTMLSTRKLATAAAAGLLLTVAACSSQGGAQNAPGASGGSGASGGPSYTIAMVTHEAPGSTFWDRIRAGAEQAAKQHGIDLKYSNDPDSGKQATLIQNAVDSKVDGIAVTLANPDAVGPALQKATEAGIPGVVFNAGIDKYQQYRRRHVLRLGREPGRAERRPAAGEGVAGGKAICVVHEQGNISLETRCAGVKQGLANTENLQVNGYGSALGAADHPGQAAQDTSITDIVTLDAGIAVAAVQAQAAAGTSAKIVTFDLSPEVVQAIKDKKIEFSVDQQPYLQGYEAVDSLWLQAVQRQRHRWRQADADRPVVRRRDQHRQDRELRREHHPLSATAGCRESGFRCTQRTQRRFRYIPGPAPRPGPSTRPQRRPPATRRSRHEHAHPAESAARHRPGLVGRLVPRRPEAGPLAPVPR